jgi:beta-phosphoglucomutase
MNKSIHLRPRRVIVDTARYHFWRGKIANELHIDFTLEHNELLKGVSRVRSRYHLEIGKVEASQEDKTNGCFKKMKNT